MVKNIKQMLIVFSFICISQLLSGCIFLVDDLIENINKIVDSQKVTEQESTSDEKNINTDDTVEFYDNNTDDHYEYTVLPYFMEKEICYLGEIYHETDNICILPVTCNTNESCTAWGDNVIYELKTMYEGFDDFYGMYIYEDDYYLDFVDEGHFVKNFDEKWIGENIGVFEFDGGYDEQVIAAFSLNNFELVFPHDYEDEYNSKWYWDEFRWIIPSEQLWMLDSFSLFTDDELLAYVVEMNEELSKWHLALNITMDISYQDSISTYVHEYAHLLFLNSEQIDSNKEYVYCLSSLYIDDKGCTQRLSYTNKFFQKFGLDHDDGYIEDNYVSEYAATNIIEDMAESFYMFVLTPKPTGDTIAEQKISFFYNFDELVFIRSEILSRVATFMYRYVPYKE